MPRIPSALGAPALLFLASCATVVKPSPPHPLPGEIPAESPVRRFEATLESLRRAHGIPGLAYSALLLKRPDERLTLVLLANSEGLGWSNPLDRTEVHRSPFAAVFLRDFRGEP